MDKLTVKQAELIELIKSKQIELGQELYVRYFQNALGMCIIKLIENNSRCEVVEKKINSRIVYTLIDKGILKEKKINDSLSLIGLSI